MTLTMVVVVAVVALAIGVVIGRIVARGPGGFTVPRPVPDCNDPGQPGCGNNPRQCGTSHVIVFGPGGTLAEFPDCGAGPHTRVVAWQPGRPGLDAADRAMLHFAPTPAVEIVVVHFGTPGRIEAFETSGGVASTVTMAPTPNVEQRFTLRGVAISRIDVIPGSAKDHTLVIGWCH